MRYPGDRDRARNIDTNCRTQASADPRNLAGGSDVMNRRETVSGLLPISGLQQVDAVCDRFEKAWLSGRRPNLAEYLSQVPAEMRPHLFRDLISLDVEYCRRRGEPADARSYCEQFPDFQAVVATSFASRSSDSTESPSELEQGAGA